jgi:predicted transcriptional regulator
MQICRVSENKDNPKVSIDTNILERNDLSLKAKGLLAFLFSRSDDYRLDIKQLVVSLGEGKAAIYSAIEELEKKGYIERERKKNEKGQFARYDYKVHEIPRTYDKKPISENRNMVDKTPISIDICSQNKDYGSAKPIRKSTVEKNTVVQAQHYWHDPQYKKLYDSRNQPYLKGILEDLTFDLGYGRIFAVKEQDGCIIDWKGSKTYFPSWMNNIHQYGNPNNIAKGVEKIVNGAKITPRMEEILFNIVSYKRDELAEALRIYRGEQKSERLLGNCA